MYKAYYGLERDPFSLDPDLDFLFLSKAHEEAIAHLAFGLEQNEDIILLSGDIGTGKTMALHRLLQLRSGTFVPVLISVTALDFEQLLRMILHKLSPGGELPTGVADLLHRLETILVELRGRGKKVLLVVDEAQNFPVEVLESIRMLLNLARPGGQVLHLVLVGQLGLEEKLNLPELRQFRQRIRVAYRFDYLNAQETAAYVEHRLEVAGGSRKIFKPDALTRIFELSGGVPRLVNHYAGKAMLEGFVTEARTLSRHHVVDEEAVPKPVSPTPPAPEPQEMVVAVAVPKPAAVATEQEFGRRAAGRRGTGRRVVLAAVVVLVLIVSAVSTHQYWKPIFEGNPVPAQIPIVPQQRSVVATPPAAVADVPETKGSVPGGELALEVQEADSLGVDAASASPTLAVIPADSAVAGPSYSVHVSSFATEDRAEALAERLRARELSTFVCRITLDEGRVWYRVYVGPFEEEREARVVASDLRKTGIVQYFALTRARPRCE